MKTVAEVLKPCSASFTPALLPAGADCWSHPSLPGSTLSVCPLACDIDASKVDPSKAILASRRAVPGRQVAKPGFR
ncbi:hypothetical protein QC762_0011580 [Podospora pseudocomata]|uniref:Uncharacterized protein n=1 Tax=Podospora pseudocomata TaxID=2093779 RepID=A0ABR0GVD2_9PEZI|nr:hypothetical protein QC762_0011580 [Podospora pseudocomata]